VPNIMMDHENSEFFYEEPSRIILCITVTVLQPVCKLKFLWKFQVYNLKLIHKTFNLLLIVTSLFWRYVTSKFMCSFFKSVLNLIYRIRWIVQ
jgi:hypothetical protein